jgi:hypothetical protein
VITYVCVCLDKSVCTCAHRRKRRSRPRGCVLVHACAGGGGETGGWKANDTSGFHTRTSVNARHSHRARMHTTRHTSLIMPSPPLETGCYIHTLTDTYAPLCPWPGTQPVAPPWPSAPCAGCQPQHASRQPPRQQPQQQTARAPGPPKHLSHITHHTSHRTRPGGTPAHRGCSKQRAAAVSCSERDMKLAAPRPCRLLCVTI